MSNAQLIRRCARLSETMHSGPAGAVRHTVRLLAGRIQNLSAEIGDLNMHNAAAAEESAPRLLDVQGIGPNSATALLIAGVATPSASPLKPPTPPYVEPAPSRRPPAKRSAGA